MQDISRENEAGPSDGDSTSFYIRVYIHCIVCYPLFTPPAQLHISNIILNGQILQALSLNEQIQVQEDPFNALFSKAQEMAHSIPEGHPSIAKVPNSLDHLKWRFFMYICNARKNILVFCLACAVQ